MRLRTDPTCRTVLAWTAVALLGAALPAVAASPPAEPAQLGDKPWARGIGSRNREYLTDLAAGKDGAIFVAGHFLGRFETAPGIPLTAVGDADAFLLRLDSRGEVEWARSFGAAGADEARAVAVGPAGEIYLAGFFSETVDFDPGSKRLDLTSAGSSDIFLARLDAAGDLVWARRLGGPFGDLALDLAVGGDGKVHLVGYFQGEVDFDPGAAELKLTSAGGTDAFVARFDADGEALGAASFGGKASDEARAVAVDANGDARICGVFRDRALWSPGGASLTSSGGSDAFLARQAAGGEALWLKRWGGPSGDSCNSLSVGADGEMAATGRFAGTAEGDAGEARLVSRGSTDAWLLRFDDGGQPSWARSLGEDGSDFGFGVAVGADRIWMVGFLQPVPNSGGGSETRSVLAAWDLDGRALESRWLTATTGIQALAVVLDAAGRPLMAGVYDGDATVDPGTGPVLLDGAGKVDLFVARFSTPD